ncbi:membrane protease subunit HflC [Desulfonatronum thiosulfatophilum]|uniref:Protein HflC n=1 Tax=Desulfonatronum thiosulfatophilum TaxID=617002 RepID=A0A1G6A0N3_9BACT|nr:protease modulator HflC [Desulfonatronum thiosulfatophilum]SDB02038.1 membrane protease subunit HflC [Desulfonatronum thiosulfatophilum]
MKTPRLTLPVFLVAAFLLFILVTQSAYIVDETERGIVLQLGRPVGETKGPGLHFKLPFIQNVLYFDARILDYDSRPAEILTRDKKNMMVDNYSKWRIVDPLRFYTTLRTLPMGQARLDDIIYAELRVLLGRHTLTEVVTTKRSQIMEELTLKSNELVQEYGIEVIDVRIKRTDLPAETQRAVFNRMIAEREREAKTYRAEGEETAANIRSQADRERVILLAQATRTAQHLRGEGDAEAVKIFGEALNRNPDFYEYMRTLEAYKKTFHGNTQIILTPSSPFLRLLQEQ